MRVGVIGAGFSGLAVAALLAKQGHDVTVFEKNANPGGRAWVSRSNGYVFDMGPSWYMMPEVHERFFDTFHKKPSDYYQLALLDPSYRVIDRTDSLTIHGDITKDAAAFSAIERGADTALRTLLKRSKEVYDIAMEHVLYTDQLNILKSISPQLVLKYLRYGYFRSYEAIIHRYFRSPLLRKAMSFMAVFLGGSPRELPGIYTLMTHADMGKNIWYPLGGFGKVVEAYERIGTEHGVRFLYNNPVASVRKHANGFELDTSTESHHFDCIIGSAEYAYLDQVVLEPALRQFTSKQWQAKVVSPSATAIFLGLTAPLPHLTHHTLFLDSNWERHFAAIKHGITETDPLFYLSCPTKTDTSVAPKGHENLFILIPQAAGVVQTADEQKKMLDNVFQRIHRIVGKDIRPLIEYQHVIDTTYFQDMFHAQSGNAFGLAHTLLQSSTLRPPIKHPRVKGLYFTGQFTNPGTGVPLVIISAQVVAQRIQDDYAKNN